MKFTHSITRRSKKDLLGCVKNFHDINEPDGSLVGRASLAVSSIGSLTFFNLGVLVHKGITMGILDMVGILLSTNNADLARSLAQPICSAGALRLWAQTIFSQTENKTSSWFDPMLSHEFLSLGLPAGQLPVVELADEYVTPEGIETYLKQGGLEEIVLVLESPDCPDSMSRTNFEHQFEFYDAVMNTRFHFSRREDFGLGGWISSLLPETDESPRTIGSAIRHGVLQAWPNATSSEEERVVGEAGEEEIKTRCLVFRKTPAHEE